MTSSISPSINEKAIIKENVSIQAWTPQDVGNGDSLVAWIDSKISPTSALDATFTTGGAIVGNWTKSNLTATVGAIWSKLQLPVDSSSVLHYCSSAITNDTYGRIRITIDGYAGTLPTGATACYMGIFNSSTNSSQIYDLTNGILGATTQGTTGISDMIITPLGGGIYRCSCIFDNNTATSTIRCYFCKVNILGASYQADGYGNIYWANAKAEQLHCSTLSTKIRKIPWINPDIRTWYTQNNITGITYNDTDGYIITDSSDVSSKLHNILTQASFYSTTGNKNLTLDVKNKNGINYVCIAVGNIATDGYFFANLSDGTISGTGGPYYISSYSTSLGSSWYRISITHNSPINNNYIYLSKSTGNTGYTNSTYQGDGTGQLQVKNVVVSGTGLSDISGPQFDFINATAVNQPLLIDQDIGGVICPYFQPDDSAAVTNAKFITNSTKPLMHILHDGTPTTLLTAFKYISGKDGYDRWLLTTGGIAAGNSGYNLYISATSTNRLTWNIYNNGSAIIDNYATITPGQIYVVSTRFDRNHYSYRVNGIEIASGAPSGVPAFTDSSLNFTLGRNNGSLPSARWAPRDILIYREYLSDLDNQKMEQFLARRCNIAF